MAFLDFLKPKAPTDASSSLLSSINASTGLPSTYSNVYGYGQPAPSAVGADTTNDPNGGTTGGGTGTATQSLAGTIYDPSAIAALKGHISDRQNQANDLYNQLFSSIDALAGDRRNSVQSQYGTAFQNNDQAYNQAVNSTDNIYGARGAYNSSYRENAQGDNKNAYNTSNQQLTDAENQNLGQIGQYVDTTKQSLNSSKPQYDLNQYTDVNQLQSLYDQLGQHIQGLQGQQAGLKTNSQYMQDLNSVTPQASNLSSQLSSQLAKLAQSSAPNDAKLAMVDAYITRNGQQGQKDYWQNYFMNLLNPQAQASQTPTAPVA
jgi:hypothetical protein